MTKLQSTQQQSFPKLHSSEHTINKGIQGHIVLAICFLLFISQPSCSPLAKSWPRSWCKTGGYLSLGSPAGTRGNFPRMWEGNCLGQFPKDPPVTGPIGPSSVRNFVRIAFFLSKTGIMPTTSQLPGSDHTSSWMQPRDTAKQGLFRLV